MTDHTEYWVAVAAAAPIIALATQVAVSQSLGSLWFFRSARRNASLEPIRKLARRGAATAWAVYIVAGINIALQGGALFMALGSLDKGEDIVKTSVASVLLIGGLFLVLMTALYVPRIDGFRQRLVQIQKRSDSGERLPQIQARSGLGQRARSSIVKSLGVSGGRASRRR